MKKALQINPLIDSKQFFISIQSRRWLSCKLLLENPKYVLAELQFYVFVYCPADARKEIFEVCPENAVTVFGAFGLPYHSPLREKLNRLTEMVYSNLSARAYLSRNEYISSITKNFMKGYEIPLNGTMIVFILHLIGLAIAIFVFLAEILAAGSDYRLQIVSKIRDSLSKLIDAKRIRHRKK